MLPLPRPAVSLIVSRYSAPYPAWLHKQPRPFRSCKLNRTTADWYRKSRVP